MKQTLSVLAFWVVFSAAGFGSWVLLFWLIGRMFG